MSFVYSTTELGMYTFVKEIKTHKDVRTVQSTVPQALHMDTLLSCVTGDYAANMRKLTCCRLYCTRGAMEMEHYRLPNTTWFAKRRRPRRGQNKHHYRV